MGTAEMLVATARLKIVRPLDGDWDNLGRILRALRAPAHRVLNAVVRELEAQGPGSWWEPTTGDVAKGREKCHPQTASYRIAGEFWRREREEAAARVAKRKAYPGDDAIAQVVPLSAVQLGLAGAAYARWQKFGKERWKGTMSLPSFTGGSPIYVAGANVKTYAEDGAFVLDMPLVQGERTRVVVQACDGSGFARLRHLIDNPDSVGDVKLVEDKRGEGGWFAFVSYSFPKPQPKQGVTMSVHRGVKCFLSVAVARSSDEARDAFTAVLETGDDILRHKQGYTARRRSLGQQKRQIGAGAKGHGVARREQHITRLEDAEARWTRTKCQEVAAHAVKIAKAKGVSRILIEDWTNPARDGAPELGEHLEYMVRTFPLAQLRGCIDWAAQKAGIVVESVQTKGNSMDCPVCGHHHEKAQHGTFRCENPTCRLERNADVVFAWNMLRRDGKVPGVKEANAAANKAGKAMAGKPRKAAQKVQRTSV